jgi:2-dehydro-3-deoxygluconokinase
MEVQAAARPQARPGARRGGLVTLGETMALLSSDQVGPLRHAGMLRLGVAGAESNVAIGVRRLGVPAAWTGRVGDDELGQLILRQLRAERVDVAAAKLDPAAPTGLMLKEQRTAELARVVYYRRGSAGSRLAPGDLDEDGVTRAGVLHLTGITPALSASARQAVHAAAELARGAGVPVSLDFNYRSALWSAAEAAAELRDLTAAAEVVFAGDDEAALVVDRQDPAGMAGALARLGPRHAVVKRGADGAVAVADGAVHRVQAVAVRAVDSVGAGDAFVAGYLAELLAGSAPARCLRTAAACGAFAVTAAGDWEGYPTRDELDLLRHGGGTVLR